MKQDQAKRQISFSEVFFFIAGYWKRQPLRLATFISLFMIAGLIETNLPNLLSAFLNAIRQHVNDDAIWGSLILFIGAYFAHLFLRNIAFRFYNIFETYIFKELVDDAFSHVHKLSETFFINTFTGGIISKITRARNRVETFEDQILIRLLPTGIVLSGSIVMMSLRFPFLAALVGFYAILLVVFSLLAVTRIIGPSQSGYAAEQDRNNARLADSVSGIATSKAYAQEQFEITHYRSMTETLRQKNRRAYLAGNFVGFIQSFLLGGLLALLLSGGTWYFLHGKANIEDMAYLTLAYTILHSYLREFSFNIKDMLTASYDLHAVILLLQETPGVEDRADASTLSVSKGEIIFDRVHFRYPEKEDDIFTDLSLSIRAGERVALVGHSGSGKTSFLRLIQRAYDIQGGSIRIDGQDIAHVTQQSLRSNMALVPQDPILFHRTLQENIAYAKPGSSLNEIRHAADQAHIDEFIQTLPLQYETLVGERGVKLSGGERQRVAIARALLANRPILILDEATSSLDSASEKAIQDALYKITHGRTSIMIAHRLSTILDADRILVFEKGQIVEEGSHTELLEKNGLYAQLFKLQSGGFIGI